MEESIIICWFDIKENCYLIYIVFFFFLVGLFVFGRFCVKNNLKIGIYSYFWDVMKVVNGYVIVLFLF